MPSDRKPIVLVHDPKDELFLGVLHPDAALFADYMDVREANREHRNFQRILSRCGFDVRTVRETLLAGTLDAHGKVVHGKELDELKQFAGEFLEYADDGTIDREEQERYKQEVLRKAHPVDLVGIILLRPKILLHKTHDNTGFSADYVIRPMMNLLFTRDSMISTPRGVVIGRLHSPQRRGERLVAEFCLNKIGVTPVFRIPDDNASYLEGGDYVLCGDTSFIGYGMRTTREAVEMLLANDMFGTRRVVAVKDKLHDQAQMHLDTYFNMADENLAVLSWNRYDARPGDAEYLRADVFEMRDGEYRMIEEDVPFMDYLAATGVEVIRVSEQDAEGFGSNFLRVAPREIIGVSKKTGAYRAAMRRHGVTVHWVDLTHCTKGYGAAHCLTQIIKR
ncbi:hypothetical protein LJC45_04620 [Alistipes sp. OttesenSCG-928-B03]|nr:hypothetical protein [Alistipes sp. OttesenSCG-928-B03]